MPRVGFEPAISVFERAKRFRSCLRPRDHRDGFISIYFVNFWPFGDVTPIYNIALMGNNDSHYDV
jgi:hypothetical protein